MIKPETIINAQCPLCGHKDDVHAFAHVEGTWLYRCPKCGKTSEEGDFK
jgi:uncharacterized Zn finger protein